MLQWLAKWFFRAAIFFVVFAFALNNAHDATVNFFFGTAWRAPMVVVVLAAFALGLALGVLAMGSRWWRKRASVPSASEWLPESAAPQSPVSERTEAARGL
jgi:lipopolysaccharide assembly protein A